MSESEKHIVESYSALLNGLSAEGKKEIINALLKSIEATNEKRENDFYNSFGAFASEKSAEEIVAEIRFNRKFKDKEIKF